MPWICSKSCSAGKFNQLRPCGYPRPLRQIGLAIVVAAPPVRYLHEHTFAPPLKSSHSCNTGLGLWNDTALREDSRQCALRC